MTLREKLDKQYAEFALENKDRDEKTIIWFRCSKCTTGKVKYTQEAKGLITTIGIELCTTLTCRKLFSERACQKLEVLHIEELR